MAETSRHAHDERLLERVAPPEWENPAPARRYDLVVLGAGTAGLVAAAGGAALGARVALVERDRLGGDCLNTGCVPSKAILRSARALADARAAGSFGVLGGHEAKADFPAVMDRLRRLRAEIAVHDAADRFRALGVDVFFGTARFAGKDRVEVAPRGVAADPAVLRFRRAIVATGARPTVPPIEGIADAGFLTSETVWSLTALPARLAVVGGGPLGCELAQAFARFGARVTVVEMGPRILLRDDPDGAAVVARALAADGVDLRLGRTLARVESRTRGATLHLARGERAEAVDADHVLVAVGRSPNVEGLGLEVAGIAYDPERGIAVDDGLRTTNRRVWAAGDVCATARFTHVADAHARLVLRNALFPGRERANARPVPWCTYTDPELAQLGHTARSAEEAGIDVTTFTQPLGAVDRALLDGETDGFARVHVRRRSDEIVGATIVARHAGETISEMAVAIAGGLGLGRLAEVVHPYPTQAEMLRKLADQYRRTRLTPRVRRLLEMWLRWGLR
jgi:pyruvate/2-oxoglutarate dehydrogenase complex dihydrolipoamide dehydrogenase (E3) component